MKVTIDEVVFNKAIYLGKLELAEWLLDNGCPTNESAYIQNFSPEVLNWLKKRDIPMMETCLSQVLRKTSDEDTVSWFMRNGCKITTNSILACIETKANKLFHKFIQMDNPILNIESYKVAILSENIEILNYLYESKVDIDDVISELAMKNKKKESIKWLVSKDLL
jgi:hypothetical protein